MTFLIQLSNLTYHMVHIMSYTTAPANSPYKIEMCHASDLMRNITWEEGSVPTNEEGKRFVRKMTSPLIFFLASKYMNGIMDNSIVYDLEFESVTRDGVTLEGWIRSATQHTSTLRNREAMIKFEAISMMSPDQRDINIFQQHSYYHPPEEVDEDEGLIGSSDDEDEDQAVDVGSLSITLIGTLNKSYPGEATLVDLGGGSTPRLAVVVSGKTIGYVNIHDQDSLRAFLLEVGWYIEGVSINHDEDTNDDCVEWKGGRIVKHDENSSNKKRDLVFRSIKADEQHSERVRSELQQIVAIHRDGPRHILGMNPELVTDDLQLIKELHNFIASVESETFTPRSIAQPEWGEIAPNYTPETKQQLWRVRLEYLHEHFFGLFPSLRGPNDCFGVIIKYLSSEGPGRQEALFAFNEAFPYEMKIWWRDLRVHDDGFRLYASNPNNMYYRERIELLQSRLLWDYSIAIQWDIPEAGVEGRVRTGLVILSSSTDNIRQPQHGDYLAVIGSTTIAKHVMGLSAHYTPTWLASIATNDGNGIPVLCNNSGGGRMTVDGVLRHVVRNENGLAFYVRTVIDGVDPPEGIYCDDPRLLPVPHRFLLADDYTDNGQPAHGVLTPEEWQARHDENYDRYVTNGIMPALSYTNQNQRVPNSLLNGQHPSSRHVTNEGGDIIWQLSDNGYGFIRFGRPAR
jgi:hypothetical protein